MTVKNIFLDTNIFLHYELYDQINWLDIVGAESIVITIPPVTIRELSKHKDYHTQLRVKKRAGEVLRRLFNLFSSSSTASLRDRIDIRLEAHDPTIDFSKYRLSHEIQDDQLLASIIMQRNELPQVEVVLVTSDSGLALLAKAREHRILTAKMPDNLRVAEQPDPAQERVKQLEKELCELRAKIPLISLAFDGGGQNAKYTIPKALEIEPDKLEHKLNEIKQRYPKRMGTRQSSESKNPILSEKPFELMTVIKAINQVSQQEIERYNAELEQFYQTYKDYSRKIIQFENIKRRTIKLVILVENNGTAPAEDIDILMFFPNGFKVLEENSLQSLPKAPNPPVEPLKAMQMLTNPFTHMIEAPFLRPFNFGPIDPTPNVSAPSIKRTDSYEVSYHVQKLKHHMQEQLKPLYIAFESFDEASSFHVDYQILAANVPHKINDRLHIVICKEASES